MSDALPALARGLINSVIAPFGNPPSIAGSRKDKPGISGRGVAGAGVCGKRSASSFRRSPILPCAAIRRKMARLAFMFNRTLQSRLPFRFLLLPPLLFADERDHHALDF